MNSMHTTEILLGSIDPEIGAPASDALEQAATPVTDVLNFVLMLEIFENELYKAVLGTSTSAVQNAAFATVRGKASEPIIASLQQIQQHEAAHVTLLSAVSGVTNALSLTADSFDFTGGRGSGTPGPFAALTTDLDFLLLTLQGVEDAGVRAYKGQVPLLQAAGDLPTLETALRIHSVEARHAAKIRRLRRQNGAATVKLSGTLSGASAGAENVSSPAAGAVTALGLIYAGEDSTTQGGIDLTSLPNMPTANFVAATAASEAFDEPLTRAQVIAIVQPFFTPTIPG
jgi:hypothetical protein